MRKLLRVDPADVAPIWRQIEEGVRRLVASGALAPESPLPSVRDLAKDLQVNPATVAKAYQRLADSGLLAVRRGEGTYVCEKPPAMSHTERGRVLKEGASRYASLAVTVGAGREEAVEELESAWSDLGRTTRGGKP
jgi:GntR family transcriptional regulator